jgi:hypothetical protein
MDEEAGFAVAKPSGARKQSDPIGTWVSWLD